MKTTSEQHIIGISAGITSLIGIIILWWWLAADPTRDFAEYRPGMDNSPVNEGSASAEVIQIGEFFDVFDTITTDLGGTWPHFRGAQFDNISTGDRLASNWGASGPKILWSYELGEGHAAPAIYKGRVYVLDYDEEKKADVLRCLSLIDGKAIWQRWYRVHLKRNHGFSRTVPAVNDRYVVTIGPRCHVMCVAARSGDLLWGLDLEKDFDTETPFWYTGQCPFIDDSLVVLAPAGKALLLGVSCATGKIIWQTPNPYHWQMSHASIMPLKLNGRRMYVYCAIGGMVGVSAEPEDRGTILWETTIWNHSVLAPSPVILDDGRIFLTAGYGAGSMVLQVTASNGVYSVKKLQEYKPKDGMASEQQTPLFYNGHFFSIQPKDAAELRSQFVCYHPDDCTRLIWSSGKTNRFGLGPYLIADGKFFILNDDGVLTLLEASTSGYRQLAQTKIMDGVDAWGPLAIADGRLLLRDSKRLVCLDVSAK